MFEDYIRQINSKRSLLSALPKTGGLYWYNLLRLLSELNYQLLSIINFFLLESPKFDQCISIG